MTAKRYSLSLTYDQLLAITDAMEGRQTSTLDENELTAHDKLLERLLRSLSRANVDEIAQLVFS